MMDQETAHDQRFDESEQAHNEEVLGGFVVGLVLVMTILAYACGALAILGLLWFVFRRLVL